MRPRIIRILDCLSALNNVIFFNGKSDESTSGRSWREEQSGSHRWGKFRKFIDFLLSWLEHDHCRKAFEADKQRHSDHNNKTIDE